MNTEPSATWRASTPAEAAGWLAEARCDWWIAGGRAIDLHLGARTREHGDLDVGCFREDWPAMREALVGWHCCSAGNGVLTPIAEGDAPLAAANQVWCHPVNDARWHLELTFDERENDEWIYRRDARIRLPRSRLVHRSDDGIPYLRPEIQLLYKAKATRPKDDADFLRALPRLGEDERTWLARALDTCHPGHAWRERLG